MTVGESIYNNLFYIYDKSFWVYQDDKCFSNNLWNGHNARAWSCFRDYIIESLVCGCSV